MVYESYPWKQDLLRRKQLILKYNTAESFSKNENKAYTIIEKGVFYSAFIIRKLIDCFGKVSDDADRYTLKAKEIKTLKHMDLLHRWPEEDSHDWENEKSIILPGKNVCNMLIHSYIFFFSYNEDGTVTDFFVSSDYDKNKALYKISLIDWLMYTDFIGRDYVQSLGYSYCEKKGDYNIIKTKRH